MVTCHYRFQGVYHDYYFPGDDRGFVAFCSRSGDTHFINAPAPAMNSLLAKGQFTFDEARECSRMRDESLRELLDNLISVGILETNN